MSLQGAEWGFELKILKVIFSPNSYTSLIVLRETFLKE